MSIHRLVLTLAAVVVAVASTAVSSPAAVRHTATAPPVKELMQAQLGAVLATAQNHVLYTWNREKKDHRVHCTGSCAKTWPPLLVAKGANVPKHVAHVMGTLGVVMRPDGTHQLTFDRVPLYRFHGDAPKQAKCNGVDGWFVVKVRA